MKSRGNQNWNLIARNVAFWSLALILFSCGMGGSSNNQNLNSDDLPGIGDLVPFPTPGGNGGTQPAGTFPLFSFLVRGVGYSEETIEVRAREILRIRMRPNTQDSFVEGTGFSPVYSKFAAFIKVGELEYATPLLHNGLTQTAQNSQIFNFSTEIPNDCEGNPDPLCRVDVTITVRKPNYDFYCYNGITCLPQAHTQVYQTHPWNTTLTIETDDTVAF